MIIMTGEIKESYDTNNNAREEERKINQNSVFLCLSQGGFYKQYNEIARH